MTNEGGDSREGAGVGSGGGTEAKNKGLITNLISYVRPFQSRMVGMICYSFSYGLEQIQSTLGFATMDIAANLDLATGRSLTDLCQYINSDLVFSDLKFGPFIVK